MNDDYQNPLLGKTYISPSLKAFGAKERRVRIASKILSSEDGYEYAMERDEVVLRKKPDAKTYITAKFLEDTRQTFVLTVQKIVSETGQPYGSGFSFVGEEIGRFCEFLANIQSVEFKNRAKVNITDEELRKIALTTHQAKTFLTENQELFAETLKSEETTEDLVAVGFRKKQLSVYSNLLHDQSYFDDLKTRKKCSNEALWQQYFEKNPWVFGYGLGYIFLSSLDDRKLEQVVQGHSVDSHGKRVDALMKTKGIISNLCFVEIKTHLTALLEVKPYRSGCWAPSKELAGAIAQVQGTVATAVENLSGRIIPSDSEGNPTGEEIYNYQPKSYLVIGSMGEFLSEQGVNRDKLRSFELLRKNTSNPEIITFDELYERAKFIVQQNQS
ncbi:Shedu immune nuclease family protein [Desulfopila sp. IMCC35008]|uniref:Shedu immune nuclease family protein n=1 Tax=Desulfopila sp. IMCC35008 TaxID=2653858 RepID=UPI0013D320C3|nr:Shedu immune nuclease family protein [Desulfopila sp. IMCC35008]